MARCPSAASGDLAPAGNGADVEIAARPEDLETWITPQGLAERISWAMRWPTEFVPSLPYPPDFARKVLGDRASPATLWACERAESLAEGVGIVLASPEFNRR